MSIPEPIIDVAPVANTQDFEKYATTSEAFQTPSYGRKAAQTNNPTSYASQPVAQATIIDGANNSTTSKKSNRAAGAAQLAAGSAIALVGIPMLILPGPGLLAIGGGVALAAGGLKKLAKK